MAILTGEINRVTYKAEDSGYAVIKIDTDGFETICAVGVMPDAEKGLSVNLDGEWVEHPKFGKQFKFQSYSVPEPDGEAGIIAYLSTLKCVKESIARAIYDRFGEEIFTILEESPEKLIEVKGIGKKTLSKITESYQQTKGLRQLIAFLHQIGVSAGYAPRIYKEHRENSIAEIRSNPYILSGTVRGFGFKRADEVARGLGILPDSSVRFQAGILHEMRAIATGGHCFAEKESLLVSVADLLSLPDFRPQMDDVDKAISALKKASTKESMRLVQEDETIYLYRTLKAEKELAQRIQKAAGVIIPRLDLDEWIDRYEAETGFNLAEGQRSAVVMAATNGIAAMTGSAGVGKSATAKAIVQLWAAQNKKIIAIAPTGKAAQRIREATGLTSACTIHRLLGWSGSGFIRNEDNPIEGDAFLIDEASMMDLSLAHALFMAIPRHATILLVGDVNQLPSVGAGNVLRDIINSGEIPVTHLTQVFRQAGASNIIGASHQINRGEFPTLETIGQSTDKPSTDALWVKCSQEKIPMAIEWLISKKLLQLGWTIDDIQMLSPQHRGDVGNIALNQLAQRVWNSQGKGKDVKGFRLGDRVIQTRNDYDKRVFNGDIGKIESFNPEEKEVSIRYPDLDNPEGRVVVYQESELDDVMLSYSISIHKSQGSEFPVVIIPMTMAHYMMLVRNLLYTGVTRAKKLLILVGESNPIAQAVRTEKISDRRTKLAMRIQG